MSQEYDAGREPMRTIAGRLLCGPCVNGIHKDCMQGKCTCFCHDTQPRKKRPQRDTSGQADLSSFGTIKVP